ncbi:hypothetical protein HHL23_09470 [Chryseobacterium sp. RP-3-3]|uniref:Uncharacterized protein n=1 Tax=Chryseobacterium antibioticum TaxID=2728847 RepID=A0A7Y0AMH2_9FLAO|nr:hypothetical protein [Chryseobacterium antibioticum]NML70029.1 hypothetical protein [Chryseobacterium antibioticum]
MENQEQEELNILSGKGYEFETILFGKIKKWNTGKMTLGKMLKLSRVFIKIKIDEAEIFSQDPSVMIAAQYKSVSDNAKLLVDAVYIAIETEFPKWVRIMSFIYKPIIKKHLLNSINSAELSEFALRLLQNSDYKNFLNSTVLMNGNRPTKAIPIEKTV